MNFDVICPYIVWHLYASRGLDGEHEFRFTSASEPLGCILVRSGSKVNRTTNMAATPPTFHPIPPILILYVQMGRASAVGLLQSVVTMTSSNDNENAKMLPASNAVAIFERSHAEMPGNEFVLNYGASDHAGNRSNGEKQKQHRCCKQITTIEGGVTDHDRPKRKTGFQKSD